MATSRQSRFVPRGPIAVAASFAILVVILLTILAPMLWHADAVKTDILDASQGSSSKHWFGTDQLGRDIFYRSLVATRLSIELALAAAAIGVAIGVPLGVLPTVLGPRTRRLVAAGIAAAISLPGLLLALFVNTIIGVGATGAVLGIGIANAPVLARLAQTLSAGVATRDYVSASRMLGASRTKLLRTHILPNVADPLIITMTISIGACLLEISTLSFLGLGVRPPSYDWGALLNEGLQGIYINPLGAIGPGIFVVFSGLAFALVGESLSGMFRHTSVPHRLRRSRRPVAVADPNTNTPSDPDEVLHVEGLTVSFPSPTAGALLTAVNDVSFTLHRGETVGIVGESGSGKSMTALGVSQLVSFPGQVEWRALRVDDAELANASSQQRRRLLGASLALVPQDPMTALNPALRVGKQLAEVARVHLGMSRRQADELAARQLGHVQLTDPGRRARQFPYEFSGGMRQRAVIAMGLMGEPKLIIADEPTTALDVTVQRQVLDLLDTLNAETGVSILLISHDIAVVTNTCTRVLVMYGGRIVEDAGSDELLSGAAHPYARMLLAAVPTMTTSRERDLAVIPGRPPTLADMPAGCPFAPRCPFADETCVAQMPPLESIGAGRRVACWHPQTGASVAADSLSAQVST